MKTVKIDGELDFIVLRIYEDGHPSAVARWSLSKYAEHEDKETAKERCIREAKIEAYNLLWQLKELGNDCELNPYIN